MIPRLVRPALGATVVAFALSVAGASPASAAITVTPPDRVVVKPGTMITVQVETPEGYVCATDWSTLIGGQRRVVKSMSAVTCNGSLATWRLRVNLVKGGTAYVNFTVTTAPFDVVLEDGSIETDGGKEETSELRISIKPPKPTAPASNRPQGNTGPFFGS